MSRGKPDQNRDPTQTVRFRVLVGFDARKSSGESLPRSLRNRTARNMVRALLHRDPPRTLSLTKTADKWGVDLSTLQTDGSRWNGFFRSSGRTLRNGNSLVLPDNVTCDLWTFDEFLAGAVAAPDLATATAQLHEAERVFVASELEERGNPSPRMRSGQHGTREGDPLRDRVVEVSNRRKMARLHWALLTLSEEASEEVLHQLRAWTDGDVEGQDVEHRKRLWEARVYAAATLGRGAAELRLFPFDIVNETFLAGWTKGYLHSVESELRRFACYRRRRMRRFQVPAAGVMRGRQAELENLHKLLSADKGRAIVLGLGGQGKTMLALAYDELHGQGYGLVAWINAAAPAMIEDQFRRLVNSWRDHEYRGDDPCGEAKSLIQDEHGLVIFDDAGHPTDILGYLPRKPATVLITTRDGKWREGQSKLVLELGGLPDDVSVTWMQEELDGIELSGAAELNQRLAGHPLALTQAFAYLVDHPGWTLPSYLKELTSRSRATDMWDEPPIDYPATIRVIWEMAEEKLGDDARLLLGHLALVAPDPIPVDLLKDLVPSLNPFKARGALQRYGMVARGEILSVHPVVQDVTRRSLEPEQETRYIDAWGDRLSRRLGEHHIDRRFGWFAEDPGSLSRVNELAPHLLALTLHAAGLRVGGTSLIETATNAAAFLVQQAAYQTARTLLENLECIIGRLGDDGEPARALVLRTRGRLEEELGNLSEAVCHYNEALAIERTVYGPRHAEVAVTLRNRGNAKFASRNVKAALADYRAALDIHQSRDAEWARTAANVGRALPPKRGLPILAEALAILERECGADHPQVARALLNIGVALIKLEHPRPAIRLFDRALAMFRKAYGDDHPAVADSLAELGVAHAALREYDQAIDDCYRPAMQIYERSYGQDNARTVSLQELWEAAESQRDDAN